MPFHCVSVCPASYTFTQRYPNAATATVARRPSTRVICHLALAGKTEMSIPHFRAGFKREMRFLEIVGALIPRILRKRRFLGLWAGPFERCSRLCAAKMAALHAAVAGRPPYRVKRRERRFPEWPRQARPLPLRLAWTLALPPCVVGSVRGTSITRVGANP